MESQFSAVLRQAIERKAWTVYRLAKEAGVSEGHLRNILAGKRDATDEVVSKLAPVLGVPVEQLQAAADADQLGAGRLAQLADQVLKPQGVSPERFREILDAIKALPQEDQDEVAADMLKMLQQRRRDRG